MYLFSNYQITKSNYFSLLISLLPISFIAGNMIININVILLILSCLIIYSKEIFKIHFHILDKLIISFFLLIIFSGIYNDFKLFKFHQEFYSTRELDSTVKSILFLKYLFLYFVTRFLIEKKYVNLSLFFIICFVCSIFVCFDIFIQFIFGKDIFGYEMIKGRLGGPFGDELIAGGYIQRFSIFSFFLLPLFFSQYSKNFNKYLTPILFSIFILGIILSGNRMPLLLFLFSLSLICIFQKQTRKLFIPFVIIFFVIFTAIYKSNNEIKIHFQSFFQNSVNILVGISNKEFDKKYTPQYLKEFASFYDTWLMNKYFGGGIKNFRFYCHERPNINKDSKFVCNMHPHNYYLEILTETGIVGFTIISLIFFSVLYLSFIKKYFLLSSLNDNNLIIPFIFLFIAEIFPFKSTGSFFTTGNATYLFLILAILIGLIRKNNLIEN